MNEAQQSSFSVTRKTIYLVRHGETEFNRLGIVQGSGVDSDLNDTGKEQARRFHARYGHLPFERIYTSALKRTHQSVNAFLDAGIPHTALPELNEISWGNYEGMESRSVWKQEYLDMVNNWKSGQLDYRIPGGENPVELQARQKPALEKILSDKEELVLICMHGRAMKSFLCLMLGLPLSSMDDFTHHNLGLFLLEYDNSRFRLLKSNCTLHL